MANERRIDPDDGEARTLEEMMQRYAGMYSKVEIDVYFRDECKPAPCFKLRPNGCKIQGLEAWLRDHGIEQYLEQVAAWCEDNGAASLEDVEEHFQDIKAAILASEIEPGDRVRVQVLKGNWRGCYVAEVLESTSSGVHLRHEEDDFVETLPWSLLGGTKYCMEPVSDDEEEGVEESVTNLLRAGRLRVDPTAGAGLELRWVKLGYRVDSIDTQPGQPDLRVGDAVVAFGGALLVGLDEDTVEKRFGQAFADGAFFVAGALNDLMRFTAEEVHREAEHVLASV